MPRLLTYVRQVTLITCACFVLLAFPVGASATPAAPTADQIDAYLAVKNSPMSGQGAAFVASGARWQLDPRLIVAIAGAESNFGAITCADFNAWGYGCPDGPFQFSSWADGIDTVARGLRTNYLAEGRTTVALIHQKYAPVGAANDPTGLNNAWTNNVSQFMVELGGDPNDVDLNGAGGAIALGPLPGSAPVDEFGFSEDLSGDTSGDALTVSTGAPKPLIVRVTNTGSQPWTQPTVRLRRIDDDPRVVGAPIAALDGAAPVATGDTAKFVVQLAAAGSDSGAASTSWVLEGPSGPFGTQIDRGVNVDVPAFVADAGRVDITPVNGGINPSARAWNVVVRVRNRGSQTWERDGAHGVVLGLVRASGSDIDRPDWINAQVPGRMLERFAAPGETATFAFRVATTDAAFRSATLQLRPFNPDGWAAGAPAVVRLAG